MPNPWEPSGAMAYAPADAKARFSRVVFLRRRARWLRRRQRRQLQHHRYEQPDLRVHATRDRCRWMQRDQLPADRDGRWRVPARLHGHVPGVLWLLELVDPGGVRLRAGHGGRRRRHGRVELSLLTGDDAQRAAKRSSTLCTAPARRHRDRGRPARLLRPDQSRPIHRCGSDLDRPSFRPVGDGKLPRGGSDLRPRCARSDPPGTRGRHPEEDPEHRGSVRRTRGRGGGRLLGRRGAAEANDMEVLVAAGGDDRRRPRTGVDGDRSVAGPHAGDERPAHPVQLYVVLASRRASLHPSAKNPPGDPTPRRTRAPRRPPAASRRRESSFQGNGAVGDATTMRSLAGSQRARSPRTSPSRPDETVGRATWVEPASR